jgi:hypothetical protein
MGDRPDDEDECQKPKLRQPALLVSKEVGRARGPLRTRELI